MNKYISDKSNCSAWIILKKDKVIAKVHAHFGGSRVVVNIYNWGKGTEDCFQKGSASGYGYDKLTSALSGLIIDGISLNNHCGTDKKTEKLLKQYIQTNLAKDFTKEDEEYYRNKAKKLGASFANYSIFYNGIKSCNFEGDKTKAKKTSYYTSLYLSSGLKKLEAFGYTVIQAI